MTTAGPLDQAAEAANSSVYAMSRVLDLMADGATAADASAATYKLAASLDTIALMLGRIGASQDTASDTERVAMALSAAHVRKAAETAREAAAMTLTRQDTTEDKQ